MNNYTNHNVIGCYVPDFLYFLYYNTVILVIKWKEADPFYGRYGKVPFPCVSGYPQMKFLQKLPLLPLHFL